MITARIYCSRILTYLARGFISCNILRCRDWEYCPMHLVWLASRGPFDSGKHLRLKRDEVLGAGNPTETWKGGAAKNISLMLARAGLTHVPIFAHCSFELSSRCLGASLDS